MKKYKVSCTFYMNGWTLSEFDTKPECRRWLEAMEEKYGTITSFEIKENRKDDKW